MWKYKIQFKRTLNYSRLKRTKARHETGSNRAKMIIFEKITKNDDFFNTFASSYDRKRIFEATPRRASIFFIFDDTAKPSDTKNEQRNFPDRAKKNANAQKKLPSGPAKSTESGN